MPPVRRHELTKDRSPSLRQLLFNGLQGACSRSSLLRHLVERPEQGSIRRTAMSGGDLSIVRDGGSELATVRLRGDWRLQGGLPAFDDARRQLLAPPALASITFDTGELAEWDSAAVTFLSRLAALCSERGIEMDRGGLPPGVQRLLALAEAVPEKSDARAATQAPPWLARVGLNASATWQGALAALHFVGELALVLPQLLRGRARFRGIDLAMFVQHSGADALPIITLISLLVGLILAFVGAVQLEQFGAAIYVADLVGIAMAREMGAMMTGIVMAGRTGAAFAAQLGSMKVNQEIDALQTMGLSPLEFLVLPRAIALCLMMPLLCLYADAVGILGGAIVGVSLLGLAPITYAQQTVGAVGLGDVVGGVCKASVYGGLIAFAGCLRGMQSGSSASAVGDATTSAVVTSIVLIIVASGVFSVVFYVLGI